MTVACGLNPAGSFLMFGLMQVVPRALYGIPMPVLGVILLFESLSLMSFIGDVASSRKCLFVSLVVGIMAFALPYGYAIGLVTGLLLDHFVGREKVLAHY